MNEKHDVRKITDWFCRNGTAVVLVLLFVLIYIVTRDMEHVDLDFGTTGMKDLNGEYYRWFTCLFLHSNLRHLLTNCAALLSVGSLLSSFPGKGKTLLIFLSGGLLAEIAYSVVGLVPVYDIGASSGIFALIACLLVCYLRFPEQFHFKWYRLDAVIVLVYFVLANSSASSFLVHVFGFAAGILLGFIMVQIGRVKSL